MSDIVEAESYSDERNGDGETDPKHVFTDVSKWETRPIICSGKFTDVDSEEGGDETKW